jgi:hypothetical protein
MMPVKRALLYAAAVLILGSLVILALPYVLESSYEVPSKSSQTQVEKPAEALGPIVTHVPTPEAVKAIYMTACVASTQNWRKSLKNLINTTELNSLVIDIKDYTGTISFIDNDLQPKPGPGCRVKDLQGFIDELHKDKIYVIGRVTVFQDPFYVKLHPELAIKSKASGGDWHDTKGLAYIDVGAKPYWEYVVKLAKTSYALGFDEINFDYIRYPSDGNLKDMKTTWTVGSSTGSSTSPPSKAEMVKEFFSYLHKELGNTEIKTSADLFGLVTVAQDDMGIGQVLENALPYFDYIDPMVYPSHFASGADGYAKPASHPYEIISYSMAEGIRRERALNISNGLATTTPSKLRPWLQDFDLGGVPYGVPEIQAQIKATYDVGLSSWLMWDASNKYTTGAYIK